MRSLWWTSPTPETNCTDMKLVPAEFVWTRCTVWPKVTQPVCLTVNNCLTLWFKMASTYSLFYQKHSGCDKPAEDYQLNLQLPLGFTQLYAVYLSGNKLEKTAIKIHRPLPAQQQMADRYNSWGCLPSLRPRPTGNWIAAWFEPHRSSQPQEGGQMQLVINRVAFIEKCAQNNNQPTNKRNQKQGSYLHPNTQLLTATQANVWNNTTNHTNKASGSTWLQAWAGDERQRERGPASVTLSLLQHQSAAHFWSHGPVMRHIHTYTHKLHPMHDATFSWSIRWADPSRPSHSGQVRFSEWCGFWRCCHQQKTSATSWIELKPNACMWKCLCVTVCLHYRCTMNLVIGWTTRKRKILMHYLSKFKGVFKMTASSRCPEAVGLQMHHLIHVTSEMERRFLFLLVFSSAALNQSTGCVSDSHWSAFHFHLLTRVITGSLCSLGHKAVWVFLLWYRIPAFLPSVQKQPDMERK